MCTWTSALVLLQARLTQSSVTWFHTGPEPPRPPGDTQEQRGEEENDERDTWTKTIQEYLASSDCDEKTKLNIFNHAHNLLSI